LQYWTSIHMTRAINLSMRTMTCSETVAQISTKRDQDVEKSLQLCSRVAQGLNVPQGYASAFRSLRPRWMAFLNILHRSRGF
jgi:hypothetical protein